MRSIERHAALLLALMAVVSLLSIYVHEKQYSKGTREEHPVSSFRQRNITVRAKRSKAANQRRLHRFDDACPSLHDPVTPILSSIPKEYVQSAALNSSTALFTYNPTIHVYHGSTTVAGTASTYLASFRVGTIPFLPEPKDYLGLALLDSHLKIIKHVVLDVNLYAVQQYTAKKRKHKDDGTLFSDYRLVWFNQTYFVTNAIAILALSIEPNDSGTDAKQQQHNSLYSIPVVFDGGLSVQALSPVRKIRNVEKGRNFNFFSLLQQDRLFLEEWPLPTPRFLEGGRKVSEIVIFDDWRFKASQTWESLEAPEPSWRGPDKTFDRRIGNICDDRGTACCVPLEREYYHDLMVTSGSSKDVPPYLLIGISHVKSFKRIPMSHGERYAYLSRFYATNPTVPPTDVVAQSGLFCWTNNEHDDDKNEPRIEWNGDTYSCPVIQFPTGISASVTDPAVVLVAYGINDVESRIVKVRKRDIARRLFSGIP
jgi:hypothetical protein